jgi:acyl-CoA thioesterase FadM
VAEIKSRGFTLSYTLKREKKSAIIADGTTTLRFFDYKTQVIARTPERFFEVMAE